MSDKTKYWWRCTGCGNARQRILKPPSCIRCELPGIVRLDARPVWLCMYSANSHYVDAAGVAFALDLERSVFNPLLF